MAADCFPTSGSRPRQSEGNIVYRNTDVSRPAVCVDRTDAAIRVVWMWELGVMLLAVGRLAETLRTPLY